MSKASPLTAVQREINYCKQNGGVPDRPTPAQQRRTRQKNNRRLAVKVDAPIKRGKVTIKPRAPWGTGWHDPFGKIKVPPHTFGNGDQ